MARTSTIYLLHLRGQGSAPAAPSPSPLHGREDAPKSAQRSAHHHARRCPICRDQSTPRERTVT